MDRKAFLDESLGHKQNREDAVCCSCCSCESLFAWCEGLRREHLEQCFYWCEATRFTEWISCCPRTTSQKGAWFQIFCIIMMIASGLITLTGRGMLSVLQGICGVVFALEGVTGFTTLRIETIINFRRLLLFYLLLTVSVGIANLLTIDTYCETAENQERCHQQATVSAYIVLGDNYSNVHYESQLWDMYVLHVQL